MRSGSIEVQFIVDELDVVETPCLVLFICFLTRYVGHLAAVTRIGEVGQVSAHQPFGRLSHRSQYMSACGFLGQQQRRFHAARLRDGRYIFRIELTGRERAIPAAYAAGSTAFRPICNAMALALLVEGGVVFDMRISSRGRGRAWSIRFKH